ncbi:hypothetical protein [Nocardia asiatica]|uniref:hypothetical protein n=2 Tax=Nocardia asiatica TaxID=209252 RepID=UPI002455DA8C|nr:hypothetical protein [Nocardia asiatica]
MSESNGAGHRSRRRAVRSAGPPPAEDYATSADARNATDTTAKVAAVDESEAEAGTGGKAASAGDAKAAAATGAAASSGDGKVAAATGAKTANSADARNATDTTAKAAVAGDAKAGAASDAKVAAATGTKSPSADDAEIAAGTGAKSSTADDATIAAARATATAVTDDKPSSADAESKTPGAPATDDATADAGKATVGMTKAGAESASDAPPTEQKPAPGKGRGVPRILATAAAALLVVALVCGAALSVLAMRSTHERDERRAEYVETARQAIVNLTTIRADSAKQDIDRILSLASGEFKTEFDGRVDPFTSIVQQAKVVSTGEIVEAALESDDESSGRVLIAAKQSLTNAGQTEPQTRYYRFRVTVSRGDSGLTVSDVEFVA